MRRVIGILLILGAGIAAFFAISSVLWQHRAIHEFVPVDVEILSAEVKVHRGKSTSYSPEATYHYTYNGHDYHSSCVLPFQESDGQSWANGIVSRLRAGNGRGVEMGGKFTGYVNPEKPNESILIREYSF